MDNIPPQKTNNPLIPEESKNLNFYEINDVNRSLESWEKKHEALVKKASDVIDKWILIIEDGISKQTVAYETADERHRIYKSVVKDFNAFIDSRQTLLNVGQDLKLLIELYIENSTTDIKDLFASTLQDFSEKSNETDKKHLKFSEGKQKKKILVKVVDDHLWQTPKQASNAKRQEKESLILQMGEQKKQIELIGQSIREQDPQGENSESYKEYKQLIDKREEDRNSLNTKFEQVKQALQRWKDTRKRFEEKEFESPDEKTEFPPGPLFQINFQQQLAMQRQDALNEEWRDLRKKYKELFKNHPNLAEDLEIPSDFLNRFIMKAR